MKSSKPLFFACILFAAVLNISCEAKSFVENSLQEKYGADTDYFIGLRALEKNDTKTALRYFNNAISKGSKYVSRRSMEQKILLGNIQQQINGAKEYLSIYNDDAALLFAGKIFFENHEYALLIDATNKIDLSQCPNELAKMRLLAMHEKSDSRLNETTCSWFITRKISADHLVFYNDNLSRIFSSFDFTIIQPEDEIISEQTEEAIADVQSVDEYIRDLMCIIKFRVLCAEKDFGTAYEMLDKVMDICLEKKVIPFTYQLTADIGKIYFSNSRKYSENGQFFLNLASQEFSKDPAVKFYAYLYAGRIYDKSGVYYSKAENAFENAMTYAPTPADYDTALWFLLNSRLAISTDKCIEALERYCSTWNNPYDFSDILDNLSLLLFTGAKWDSFEKLYKLLDGHADNVSTSKFAYLTGQLINNGFLNRPQEEKEAAFRKAYELNAGTDVYYRLLAAKQLQISKPEIERKIFASTTALSAKNDVYAEKLLTGYADFGFVDLIYPEWLYFYTLDNDIFGIEAICYVANFLRSCGNAGNNNFYKSLHMISKTTNLDNSRLSRDIFELSYPKNFSKEVAAAAKEFGVEDYDMLGLIRTESFFNPIVESHAGALGLSQLMESTFEDCAQKLKIKDPDITDPMTNIRIGTYYYSDLVKRLDDSDILALFAYNAGITRVRRWLKSSKVGLGLFKNLPSDLFLETIPITETRNYGRKVIQSAAIYGWLYYGKNPCDIIDEMM